MEVTKLTKARSAGPGMQVIYVHGVSDRPWGTNFKQRLLKREQRFERRVTSKLQKQITKFRDASWGDLVPLITISSTAKLSTHPDTVLTDTAEFDAEALRRSDGKFDAADLVEAAAMQGPLTEEETDAVEDTVEQLAKDGVLVSPDETESPVHALMREIKSLVERHERGEDNLAYLKTVEVLQRRIQRPAEDTLRKLQGRDYWAHQLASRWKDAMYYVGHGRREISKHVFDVIRAETSVPDSDPVLLIGHSLGALVCWDILNSEEFRERGLAKDRKWIFLALGSQLQSYQELQIIPTLKLAPHLSNVRWRHIRDTGDPLSFPIDDAANEVVCKTGQNWVNAHTSYLDNDKVLDAVQKALSDILLEWG